MEETKILPASPELILQCMKESVQDAVEHDAWDVEPMFGLVCDTPEGVKFLQLPLPEEMRRTMAPVQALSLIAMQMEVTAMTPPVHPAPGWNTRGFIFMAEGWGVSVNGRDPVKLQEEIAAAKETKLSERDDAIEFRMCTAVLSTDEVLAVLWQRGETEPTYSGVPTPDDKDAAVLDGEIVDALRRMAAVM
jgi:hypothetical protein